MGKIEFPIEVCPYCNSGEGFYIKQQIYGSANFKCNFDGSEANNSDLHDNIFYKDSKFVYCTNCNKRLFSTKDLGR